MIILIFIKKEILPFNFIVYTSKGEIIITPQKSNLKHLLGIGNVESSNHSYNEEEQKSHVYFMFSKICLKLFLSFFIFY